MTTAQKITSFADKHKKRHNIYLIRGMTGGRPAWYYIKVKPCKEALFNGYIRQKRTGVELQDFGKIIGSGWGESPTEEEKTLILNEE
jgi:hypothetical protein